MTIRQLISESAKKHGARIAFSEGSRRLSFSQLDELTRSISIHVMKSGGQRGERAGIILPRSLNAILAYLGIMRSGLTAVPMSTAIFHDSQRSILDLIRPRFLFCREADAELLEASVRSWPCQLLCDSMLTALEPAHSNDAELESCSGDTVYYNMTSGTSGIPKFAATTHSNLLANTEAVLSVFKAGPDDVYLCLFPIDLHPHEHFMRGIMSGCESILVESKHPRVIVDAIRSHRVTWLKAAPVMLDLIANHIARRAFPPISFRWLEISGVTSNDQLENWRKSFKAKMRRVWGSTETTGIAFCCDEQGLYDHTLLGNVLDGYRAAIMDADGSFVPDDVTGRLVLKGAPLFRGYLDETDGSIKERGQAWHDTGDLARRANQSKYHFEGRAREILKIAGRKVFAGAIEGVLRGLNEVEQAAVVGMADPKREDVAVAFVSLSKDGSLSESDVIRSYRRAHPELPAPDKIVFVRRLPLTAGGKPDYSRLKEKARDYCANQP